MQVEANTVVSIHYTLTNAAGETIDSSRGSEPLVYLQGVGQIVRGLEEAMQGRKVGETFDVAVPPELGYGKRLPEMVQDVPLSAFDPGLTPEPGMQFQAQTQFGVTVVTVVSVNGESVRLDGNHALAGETLHFAIEVVQVRAATAEEISHGHVHGHGGVHH